MATKKYKAPTGMNPEDAKDWEKHGTFVHHDPGGGRMLGADGKPLDLAMIMPFETRRLALPAGVSKMLTWHSINDYGAISDAIQQPL